jgi:acyl-coenzyme A thioesterase 13
VRKTIDEAVARSAFEHALATYDQDFNTFFLARLFGTEFEYLEDACRISFDVKDFMSNPRGGLHGGVIAFVLDISMGHLIQKKVGGGTTVEMKVQYLKAVSSGRVTATGRFLRQGRTLCYLRSELVDEKGEMIAYATGTWMALRKE